jgi:hypothetical protein
VTNTSSETINLSVDVTRDWDDYSTGLTGSTCPFFEAASLAPGASCVVLVGFRPSLDFVGLKQDQILLITATDPGRPEPGVAQGEGHHPLLDERRGLVGHLRSPALPWPQDLRTEPLELVAPPVERHRGARPSPDRQPGRCRAPGRGRTAVDGTGRGHHPVSLAALLSARLPGQARGCVAFYARCGTSTRVATTRG